MRPPVDAAIFVYGVGPKVVNTDRRTRLRSRVVGPSVRSARAIAARRVRIPCAISEGASPMYSHTTASDVVLEQLLAPRRCKCALSSPALSPLQDLILRSRTADESGRQGAPEHGWHAAISRFARPANLHIVPGTVVDYETETAATALKTWGHIESCLF